MRDASELWPIWGSEVRETTPQKTKPWISSCGRYNPLILNRNTNLIVFRSLEAKASLRSNTMPASAHLEGVKVEVISNGQSLSLYDDPDAIGNEEPRTRQNYIEAVTGATFEVKVTLSDTFEMGRCDAARASISFDGDKNGFYSEVSRTPGWKNRPLEDRQIVFSRISQFCEGSGQWRSGKLCFGELAISKCSQSMLRHCLT